VRSARGFVGLVLLAISSTAVLVAAGTGAVSLGLQYREMRESTGRLREEYLGARRALLEQEAARTVGYIDHLRETAPQAMHEVLRSRASVAEAVAEGVYEHQTEDPGSPLTASLETMIASALSASASSTGGGDLFVLASDGRCILFVGRPDLAARDLSNVQGTDGTYVVRELLRLARQDGEGFCSVPWTVPGDAQARLRDVTFVRRFEALGWVICASGCTRDIDGMLKRQALSYIASAHFGEDGRAFAGRLDGSEAPPVAAGESGVADAGLPAGGLAPRLAEVARQGGGPTLAYDAQGPGPGRAASRLAFVLPVPEWDWYVGAEISVSDVDQQVREREKTPRRNLTLSMCVTAGAGLAVALIGLAGGVCFSRALAREAQVFGGWFRQARTAMQEIDVEELHFTEFRELAEDANAMVRTRRQADKRQRELEEALQQNQRLESIGVLAGGIAHGFNNLLAAILGYGELALRKVPDDSPARSDLANILVAAERARDLVRQILSFSRRAPLDFRPVALRPLLEEAVRLLRATIPTRIEIRYAEEGDNPVAFADAAQIHQVILNLCANAQHAMKEEGGVLELSLDTEHIDASRARQLGCFAPGLYGRLTVRDNGCGMDQGTMSKVFEPFFTTKGPGEGTGLGLSFSHGVVTSHGGTMTLESRVGQGTTFCVYLPCVELTDDVPIGPTEVFAPARPVSVLLVDDDPALLDACLGMLTVLGHEVEAFADGGRALEALREAPDRFELLMTDQTMPRISGLQLAAKAKEIAGGLRVLLVTGYSPEVGQEDALAMGVEGFLMKPFTLSQLSAKVNEIMAWERGEESSEEGADERSAEAATGEDGVGEG
jgi:signal transduction histidine kinase/FixJ family two-component response regulator